jgi:hypothetical protein
MMRHLLHEPSLIWIVMFAVLTTKLAWPASTWRAVTIFVCWVVALLMVLLRFAL